MKFVDLSQHLHELRYKRSGRTIGAAMSVVEVWNGAIDCPLNGISELRYYESDLPRPFDGLFARMENADGTKAVGVIYVHRDLPRHWKEFVAIKEMMHCWSPGKTYVGTPRDAERLVNALNSKKGRYSAIAASDTGAVLAAAEVILPHHKVEWHIGREHDYMQIAAHHGLHPDVVEMICSFEVLQQRKNGTL